MAITRRQFVTRLGAFAAAAGLGQGQISKLTEAFAYSDAPGFGGILGKPRVVWVHGAECTGCSTSLLSLFEDPTGTAIVANGGAYDGTTSVAALGLATDGDIAAMADFSYHGAIANYQGVVGEPAFVNIADVLVDIIDLQYHETVENMGGDLAASFLADFMAHNTGVFVLVVEGAVQAKTNKGAWNETNTTKPWCSIGITDKDNAVYPDQELSFEDVVSTLANQGGCVGVVAIGQCAAFGGYPGCKSPTDPTYAGFDTSQSQTGAMGVFEFLASTPSAAAKVINVPGCPTNPWWFVLTVVCFLVDAQAAYAATLTGVAGSNSAGPLGILAAGGAIKASAVDSTRRLKIVYPYTVHGPYCPRFEDWRAGNFAEKPGDPGCLQLIGCKGPATRSLCGVHGWNAQQGENDATKEYQLAAFGDAVSGGGAPYKGSHCTSAGHPCMACTEQGYPDSFVPFVNW